MSKNPWKPEENKDTENQPPNPDPEPVPPGPSASEADDSDITRVIRPEPGQSEPAPPPPPPPVDSSPPRQVPPPPSLMAKPAAHQGAAGQPSRPVQTIGEKVAELDETVEKQAKIIKALIGVVVLAVIAAGVAVVKTPMVGTDRIENDAITTPKLADNSVTADKIQGDTLPNGPRGPQGEPGPRGPAGPPGIKNVGAVSETSDVNTDPRKHLTVQCPQGETLLTGGAVIETEAGQPGVNRVVLHASGPVENKESWTATAVEIPREHATAARPAGGADVTAETLEAPVAPAWGLTVTVVCAEINQQTQGQDGQRQQQQRPDRQTEPADTARE